MTNTMSFLVETDGWVLLVEHLREHYDQSPWLRPLKGVEVVQDCKGADGPGGVGAIQFHAEFCADVSAVTEARGCRSQWQPWLILAESHCVVLPQNNKKKESLDLPPWPITGMVHPRVKMVSSFAHLPSCHSKPVWFSLCVCVCVHVI